MITQEEARIRIGVDGTAIEGGMAAVRSQVEAAGNKLNKFFTAGLGAGVALQGIALLKQGVESLVTYFVTEYTKMWYGDSAAQAAWSERLAESTKRLRDLRKELVATAKEYATTLGESIFKRASDAEKENILVKALSEVEKKTREARTSLASLQEQLASATGNKTEFIAAVAAAESELNKRLTEEIKLHDKLDEVQETIAEKREKAAEKEKKEWEEKLRQSREWQKQQNEILAAQASDVFKGRDAARRGLESFMPSLQDLAASGRFWGSPNSTGGFGFQAGPFAGMAQSILNLGARATDQLTWGNVAGARASIEERNRRYDQLAKAGIMPQRAEIVAEAQIETANVLKQIKDGSVTVQTALTLVQD